MLQITDFYFKYITLKHTHTHISILEWLFVLYVLNDLTSVKSNTSIALGKLAFQQTIPSKLLAK